MRKPPPTEIAAEVAHWLINRALATPTTASLFVEFAEKMRALGAQIDRLHCAYTTLHPLHSGEGVTWSVDEGVAIDTFLHGNNPNLEDWVRSPILFAIRNNVDVIRRRLSDPDESLEFDLLKDLRFRGYTDYLLNTVPFETFFAPPSEEDGDAGVGQSGMSMSVATRRPGGFTDAEIATLTWLRRPLALVTKVAIQHGIASELARCYIGHAAGPRVLRGAIRRGDFDSTRAVVWFSDLRDSTEIASSLPRKEYVTMLNRFFDCTAGAVQAEGGEPLTFIGDGVLAIFPVDQFGEEEARQASIRAAKLATRSLGDYNAERAASGERSLGFGVALHAGEMEYGNIGVPARQSWSVIGPVVNETARLEGMTKVLGEPIVASAEFAAPLDPAWRSLGAHSLKGVSRPFEVFAPPVSS